MFATSLGEAKKLWVFDPQYFQNMHKSPIFAHTKFGRHKMLFFGKYIGLQKIWVYIGKNFVKLQKNSKNIGELFRKQPPCVLTLCAEKCKIILRQHCIALNHNLLGLFFHAVHQKDWMT